VASCPDLLDNPEVIRAAGQPTGTPTERKFILNYLNIAGLSEKKAEKIIEHRTQKGPFKTRKDLLSVRSIGEKSFVQCAGFVRIEPRSVGGQLQNPLDCTWVHPESYNVVER